jgi:CHASE2 domain-containing sensor protein
MRTSHYPDQEEYKEKLANVKCDYAPEKKLEMYESIMFTVANDYLKSRQKPLLCSANISIKEDESGACRVKSASYDDEIINFRITKNIQEAFTKINLSVGDVINGKDLKDMHSEPINLEGKILLVGDSRVLSIRNRQEMAETFNGKLSYLQLSAHAINGMIQNSMTGRNPIRSNDYYNITIFLLFELLCLCIFMMVVRGKVLRAITFLILLLLFSFLLCCVMLIHGLWITTLPRAVIASLSAAVVALLTTPIIPSNTLPQDE